MRWTKNCKSTFGLIKPATRLGKMYFGQMMQIFIGQVIELEITFRSINKVRKTTEVVESKHTMHENMDVTFLVYNLNIACPIKLLCNFLRLDTSPSLSGWRSAPRRCAPTPRCSGPCSRGPWRRSTASSASKTLSRGHSTSLWGKDHSLV